MSDKWEARARQQEAARLARTFTYSEIAAKLGLSRSAVAGLIHRHKRRDLEASERA